MAIVIILKLPAACLFLKWFSSGAAGVCWTVYDRYRPQCSSVRVGENILFGMSC